MDEKKGYSAENVTEVFRAGYRKVSEFPDLSDPTYKLSQQVKDLQSVSYLVGEDGMENFGRWVTVDLTRDMLFASGVTSLGQITEHPDMPSDARPVFSLAVISPCLRVVFESKEWDVVLEGFIPPTIKLEWDKDGPVKTGVVPEEF